MDIEWGDEFGRERWSMCANEKRRDEVCANEREREGEME